MANILLLDESETASRAMNGILTRGNHRLLAVKDATQTWNTIRSLVRIDLLIMEVRLEGANSLMFLQRLRGDCILKHLPVVIYTSVNDHTLARRALGCNVQNYLIKPYHDETIYAEVDKACANPWRNLLFEEEKSFCTQLGLTADDLLRMRQSVITAIDECALLFPQFADTKPYKDAAQRLTSLKEAAENSGIWAVVEYCNGLSAKLHEGDWTEFKTCQDDLKYLQQLILCQINPGYIPEGLLSEPDPDKAKETADRALWLESDVDLQGPLVQVFQIQAMLDRLPGMPVIDTVAASFQMATGAKTTNWGLLLDQVCKDPALSALILMAANRLDRAEKEPIEDTNIALGLLGDMRLGSMSRSLQTIDERLMRLPPSSWASYWMFQMGVAKIAHYSSRYLGLNELASSAFTAGLMHDIGNLLLIKLFPFGYQAIVNYARQKGVSLRAAQLKYLGWDSRELGFYFAHKHGLPESYCNVIHWVGQPEKAPGDAELVGVVSFARDLCLHHQFGFCGDTPKTTCPVLEESPGWKFLHNRVMPSANLRKLEAEVRNYCSVLHQELIGKQ
jgi:CheY-like chemotaxis protein